MTECEFIDIAPIPKSTDIDNSFTLAIDLL